MSIIEVKVRGACSISALSRQTGTGLVEVMVSLFLLAIGLLGILSLQNTSQRSNQSAMFSSQAMVYVDDIANRVLASDNPLIDTDNAAYDGIDTESVTAGSSTSSCSGGCTRAAIVNRDKQIWADAVTTNLPSGRGTVAHNNGIYTITVMWDDQLTGATGTGCGGNPEVDLQCAVMQFQL
jgi:type IV pilus assembly protein PilV